MSTYIVEIPITGSISVEVEASDKRTALEAAWDKYNEGWEESGFEITWEACERVTSGNVSHAQLNEQCATLVKPR